MQCGVSREIALASSGRLEKLNEEFDAQVDVLFRTRVHLFAQATEKGFRKCLEPLRALLSEIEPAQHGPSFLVVVPQGLVSTIVQGAAICFSGRNVKSKLVQDMLYRAGNGAPMGLPYLATGIDMGSNYPSMSANDFRKRIKQEGGLPFFAEEFLALLRCRPTLQYGKYICANTLSGRGKTTFFQIGPDSLEFLAEDSGFELNDCFFPSCRKRYYVTEKLLRI
jgi:hypothetical protein